MRDKRIVRGNSRHERHQRLADTRQAEPTTDLPTVLTGSVANNQAQTWQVSIKLGRSPSQALKASLSAEIDPD